MDEIKKETNIPKGIIVTIIWFIILIPMILIPLFGIIFLMTLYPFIAGYMGGKYANRNFILGGISGLIWATILTTISIKIMSIFAITGVNFGAIEFGLLILFFSFIIFFCGIGSMFSSG